MTANASGTENPRPDLLRQPTLWQLLEARVALTPDRPAVFDADADELTYAGLRDKALETATRLHAMGIGPGTRVAWQLPTRISTMVTMLALGRLGAFQIPLVPMHRERELRTLLPATGAEFVLVPGTWHGIDYTAMAAGVAEQCGIALRTVVVGPDGVEGPQAMATAELPPAPVDGREPRWAFATSGSTGKPKAALHHDEGLLTSGYGFALNGRLGRPGEMGTIAYPIAHIGGAVYLGIMLSAGYPVVLIETYSPSGSIEIFRAFKVTVAGASTVFYQALLDEQRRAATPVVPSLRLLKGGGAPLSATLYRALREELGVAVAHDYGMTEVPMIAVADPTDPDAVLAETDGRVLPWVEARTVRADGTPTAPGEAGEIQLRGLSVTSGYTDASLNADAFTTDGFFRTGDLGVLRPSGHISVTGRLKDVIIRKGENISPQEIEELLIAMPEVAEVAVIGLPDVERGERACAVVRLNKGARPLTLDDIRTRLRGEGIMAQKIPEQLEIVPEMPLTGVGKAAKAQLRARFADSTV